MINFNKGKARKIALALLVATVICAVIACVTCFFTVHNNALNVAEDNTATTEEISTPDLNITSTAKTSLPIPSFSGNSNSTDVTGSGQSATVTYDGESKGAVFNNNYNSSLMNCTGGPTAGAPVVYGTNAGTYSLTFTLKDTANYQWSDGTTGSKTCTLTIKKRSLSVPSYSGNANTEVTGSGQSATATYDGENKQAVFNNNYDSSYITCTGGPINGAPIAHGINAGTHTVTFTLRDTSNCQWNDGTTGSKTCTLTIKKASLPIPTYSGSGTTGVTGSGRSATATYTGTEMQAVFDENYDTSLMSCSGGIMTNAPIAHGTNVGTYFITFTLKDTANYQWSDGTISNKTCTITITPKSISGATVSTISAYTFDNTPKKPEPTIKDGTTTLTKGTHYTLSYKDNTNAGTATVTISGTGNYGGTKDVTFTINKRNISNASFGTIAAQTYTGSQIKPEPTITDKTTNPQKTLVKGTDFTFSYESNVNAGTATIKITGTSKGNYTGTNSTTFTINGKSLANATIGSISAQTYDGNAKKPTATVTLDSVTLASGTDFEFSYSNNVNAGTATLTITGKGNYSGTAAKNFTISAKSISTVAFETITDKTYTGNAIKPTPTVKDETNTLVNGTDFDFTYENNVNAGTATIKVTGKGNYKGTASTTFTILKGNLAGATFGAIAPYVYDGTAHTPKPAITLGGVTLVEGTDFEFSYEDNINVGQGKVIITGINNYEGTKIGNFTIRYATIADATVELDLSTTYYYDGTAKQPPVISVKVGTVLLAEGTDYTVSYQNNINAGNGTAKVVITGTGAYAGTQTVTFTINAADISSATIGRVDASYPYTGSAIRPSVTVTFDGNVLTVSDDYTVSYENNVALGTATITVTGTGNYTGSVTKNFVIEAGDISGATISGLDANYPYSGSEITPDFMVTLGNRTLIKDADYTVTYAQNTNLGTAVITVTGAGNYQGSLTASFTIVAADISTAEISGIDATYPFAGSGITPTPTVTFGSTVLTALTDYTVSYQNNVAVGTATLTVTGTGNFTGTVSATFTIVGADLSSATVEGIDASYTYTGSDIEPEPIVKVGDITLVKGADYTVSYSDNLNVGTATVTITGIGNYNLTKTVNFDITAADISSATIEGVDASYTFTGSAIEPEVTVKLGNVTLTLTADYTVDYANNQSAGTATVTVTGTGNYTGTASTTFEITAADLSLATIEGLNASYPYSGNAIEPPFTVKLGDTTLVLTTDYTVTITDNVDVGTATVTVTGAGNYRLTVTKTFAITKATPEVTVTFDDYDGVSVKYAGTALPAISYTATFGGSSITGTLSWGATVLISDTTDYGWTFTPDNPNLDKVEGVKFINVVAPQIASLTVSWRNGSQPDIFTSTTLEQVKAYLKVEATLTDGKPFGNEILAGAYRLVGSWTNAGDSPSVGDRNWTLQVFLNEYPSVPPATIEAYYQNVELTGITVTAADGQTVKTDYTALDEFDTTKIKVIATYNDGREPVEISKDAGRGGYKVIYADGHNCFWYGDTQVTISFTDGNITKTEIIIDLSIEKKVFDISTITFNDRTVTYNGKDFTLTVNGFTLGTVSYTYVKRVEGEPDAPLAEAKAKNAGVYGVTAHFTFTEQINIVNYEAIEDITKTLTINKARHEEEVALPSVSVDYDHGKPLADSVTVQNLPQGVTVNYVFRDANNNAIEKDKIVNAGAYTVTVTFTDVDEENYEPIDPITATFIINKLDPKVAPAVGGTIASGTKLSELPLTRGDGDIAGTYVWENAEQTLKNGRNVCWYVFTPDDTVNYNTVKNYFEWDVATEGSIGLSAGALTGIIIGAIIALAVAVVALVIAVRSRRNVDDEGFNDEVTEEDLLNY